MAAEAPSKPRVLILGGVGVIGRNLVKYLLENELVSSIRVADKAMPITSYMAPEVKALYDGDDVEYVQSDLTRDAHVTRAFNTDGGAFNYVINLAAETKFGQTEAVYEAKVRDLSTKVAAAAAEAGVEKYVEMSTAQVYKAQSKRPCAEGAKLAPWTLQARFSLEAEEAVAATEGLPYVILRPATVYGPYDTHGLMPRVVVAVVYKTLDEKMKLLWDKKLQINTVHVQDVVRAIWHSCTTVEAGSIFNLADSGDTTQGKVNALLGEMFSIRTGFQGKVASNLARLNLGEVAGYINDKHLKPWSDTCTAHGITNTPLTPFLDKELLYNNPLYIDGSAICDTGFEYSHPELTIDALRDVVTGFIDQGLFPPVLDDASGGGGGGSGEESKDADDADDE